jgi:hypothetical protein
MFSVNSSTSFITIKSYESTDKNPFRGAVRHLDIGSANYGPGETRYDYTHSETDPLGKKIHNVLFEIASHTIQKHPEHNKFVFFLTDINSDGLDRAASNLANFFNQQKYSHLVIEINKIAGDIFRRSDWPTVDSASYIHPDIPISPSVINDKSFPSERDLRITKLLQKIVARSKTGLIVKECELSWYTPVIAEKISKGIGVCGLEFQLEKTSYLSQYIFPSGQIQESEVLLQLSYRITQMDNFSPKKQNFLDFLARVRLSLSQLKSPKRQQKKLG